MQKQITILGRTYTVRADESDDIERAAADVDARMRALAGRAANMDGYTVALLTALNLASDLRAVRRRVHGRLDELEREAAAIEAILEAAVAETETVPAPGTDPEA